MPIKPYVPPAASLRALREAATMTPKAYQHNAAMIKDVLADVPAHWPHPVYDVGLNDLVLANGLNKAEIISWRYLARSGNDRNYAIEVQIDDDNQSHTFSELDKGPHIDGLYQIVNDKNLIKQTEASVFKPAVLRINAMGIFAVWLRTADEQKEILIPLPPTRSYLVAWQQYSIKHFQDALRDKAKAKIANEFSDA